MLYKQAMPTFAGSGCLSSTRQRNTSIGLSIAGFAVAYPFLVYTFVWGHYALTHSDLKKGTDALLLLLTFPICLGCVFSLILSIADGRGKKRVAGVLGALLGIVVNALFLLANGTV